MYSIENTQGWQSDSSIVQYPLILTADQYNNVQIQVLSKIISDVNILLPYEFKSKNMKYVKLMYLKVGLDGAVKAIIHSFCNDFVFNDIIMTGNNWVASSYCDMLAVNKNMLNDEIEWRSDVGIRFSPSVFSYDIKRVKSFKIYDRDTYLGSTTTTLENNGDVIFEGSDPSVDYSDLNFKGGGIVNLFLNTESRGLEFGILKQPYQNKSDSRHVVISTHPCYEINPNPSGGI